MTAVSGAALAEYLSVRRAVGYKLERDEKLLVQFAQWCNDNSVEAITTEAATAWAILPGKSQGWHQMRLSVVRTFAQWHAIRDDACEVPPAGTLGPVRHKCAVPYLYSDAEIVALMTAADTLRYPITRITYATFVGLLAVTGMRLGEACRLDRGDFDPDSGWLQIRDTKFGKSRQLALSTDRGCS